MVRPGRLIGPEPFCGAPGERACRWSKVHGISSIYVTQGIGQKETILHQSLEASAFMPNAKQFFDRLDNTWTMVHD